MVIVVDGDSELERDLAGDLGGIVIANCGPRGLSGARNTGVAATRAPLIAFLDDDAVAHDDWLRHLSEVFDDEQVMVAGGTVTPQVAGPRPGWWPVEFDWVVGCSYPGQMIAGGGVQRVRNVIGASMMIRRAALEAVGAFSTDLGRIGNLPVGGEETELCIRVAARFGPHAIVLEPRAEVYHHVPVERLTMHYLHARCLAEGRSKAVLGRIVRSRAGLSSEARYLTHTLPRAFLRHAGAALRGDLAGLARAGAIVSATAATVCGWLLGTVSARALHADGGHGSSPS